MYERMYVCIFEKPIVRLAVDSNITHDGMHWRSPGDFSVPVFILQAVLHSLAVRDTEQT